MAVTKHRLFAALAFIALSLTPSLFAATVTKLNDDVLAPLRAATIARTIHLDRLPLYGSRPTPIDLEEFQVWAPDGQVFIHDGHGNVQKLDPPAMRYFRGQVNGDPESFAYFSVELNTGRITGLVTTKDDNFAVDGVKRPVKPHPYNRTIDQGSADAGYDYFLTSTNANDMNMPEGRSWQCDVEEHRMTPSTLRRTQTDANGLPIQSQALTPTQHYSIRLTVETDDELYANSGNSTSAETTYITNLTGAVSTIYNRDLKTDVLLVETHLHSGGPGTDPWLQGASTQAALYEFGTYYHNNPGYHPVAHSSAVFLSGKNLAGGIAWEGTICDGDFFCGPDGSGCSDSGAANMYAGAYAWCGSIGNGGFVTAPNPDLTNGVPYGMPAGFQTYWPLAEYAHELGHNLAGHHTHCVVITDAERIASGFTDGSPATAASDVIDHCFAHELGCFSASTDYVAGSQTTFRGTIMSYCHNVFVTSVPQSRFTFGQAAEPSIHELNDYMFTAAPLTGVSTIINNTFDNVTGFTVPVSVAPSSTGNVASISVTSGSTYNWTIMNGTITAGQGTTGITFTAGASGSVILKANAYGSNNCGITDTRTVTITAVSYNPPTSVEAHVTGATSALVSWTAATGTPPGRYNVYRSADAVNYSPAGNTMSTSFADTVSTNNAYLYKVLSADSGGGNESVDSNRDLATIVVYTHPTLTAGSSTVQAVDMTELRTAVNAVRTLYGIGAGAYSFPTLTPGSTLVHALDMTELRTNLSTPITGMGFAAPTYTNTISASSIIKAIDFTEARNAMR